MAKKRRLDTSTPTELGHNPFVGLGAAVTQVPDAKTAPSAAEPEALEPAAAVAVDPMLAGKLVVRREKKGRRGKGVTVVEGLRGTSGQLDQLAKRLRKDLGCGAYVEGANVVVSGTQHERTRAWLERAGAPTVILGN